MTNTVFTHNNKVRNQREAFGEELLVTTLDWVTSTFYPDDIYEAQELKDRVAITSRVQDVFLEKDIIKYVKDHVLPGDVYSREQLLKWAFEEGLQFPPQG